MRFYDQHGHFGCLIDVLAFDATVEGETLQLPSSENNIFHDSVLIFNQKYFYTTNVRGYSRVITKLEYDIGKKTARELSKCNPVETTSIELQEITESESKVVDVKYTNVKIASKEMVLLHPVDYESNEIYTPVDSNLYIPIDYTFTKNDQIILMHSDFVRRVRNS